MEQSEQCLGPARLNQALILPTHRGLTLNNILPKLTNVHYMTMIDVSLHYDNKEHDKKILIFTTFAFQFGGYRFTDYSLE